MSFIKRTIMLAALAAASTMHAQVAASLDTAHLGIPASAFNLKGWKLQIPGPKEFKDITHYSSDYFFLNKDKEMCFKLDAGEKGATQNAKFVRSELRHLQNWKVGEDRVLAGEVRVTSHLEPDKVTVLQIHGIMDNGSDAPPLLRIAVQHGDLYALLKTENDGEKTESIVLKKGVGTGFFKVEVSVKHAQLKITVDGQVKLDRSLAYWKFSNYFKAGCYPQATKGTAEVFFRSLSVK